MVTSRVLVSIPESVSSTLKETLEDIETSVASLDGDWEKMAGGVVSTE